MALVQIAQLLDQLLVAVPMCPCAQDALRRVEELRRHDALERAFLLDPHVGAVNHPVLLEFERPTVVDVVADVFLVGQHLANGRASPIPPKVGTCPLCVQPFGDVQFRQVVGDKPTIDLVDHGDLIIWPRLQNDSVGL